MQSGYELSAIQQQQHNFTEENMNQNTDFNPHQQIQYHILEQIHTLPTTQPVFQTQDHFPVYFQHQRRLISDCYCEPSGFVAAGGGGSVTSVPLFPSSLKFDLNNKEISTVNIVNDGEDALLRGSEQFHVPETRQTPLPTSHCLQNWKPLSEGVSNNDESEIEDKHEEEEEEELNRINRGKYFQQPQMMMNRLERDSRLYGELEAIYKRADTAGSNQTGSGSVHFPVTTHLPPSEASIGEYEQDQEEQQQEESTQMAKKKRKRKKTKDRLDSMEKFLERLVKQIMEHQQNLHRKFTEVIKRLDRERREREEAWRKEEVAKFELEAAARARELAMSTSREAAIVAYLEKITGQKINLPPLKSQPENPLK